MCIYIYIWVLDLLAVIATHVSLRRWKRNKYGKCTSLYSLMLPSAHDSVVDEEEDEEIPFVNDGMH